MFIRSSVTAMVAMVAMMALGLSQAACGDDDTLNENLVVETVAPIGSVGGQVLSAFAISVAPAVVAYVMVIMGEQMVTNPKVDPSMGLAAIWSGDILLILGNLYLYGRVMRR